MGKTRDLFKKIRDTKGTFHTKKGTIKGRNGMDLTEAEDIKKRWQEYTATSLQSCPTLCNPHGLQPTRLRRPWDSPGKNTGVGCHFLLQCMRVKSGHEVTQSCLNLSDPMDCSLPGSSVGIFQARVLEWVAIAFSNTARPDKKNTFVGARKISHVSLRKKWMYIVAMTHKLKKQDQKVN